MFMLTHRYCRKFISYVYKCNGDFTKVPTFILGAYAVPNFKTYAFKYLFLYK